MSEYPDIETGIYTGVPREGYDFVPFVNCSTLKKVVRSTKAADHAIRKQQKDSAALRFGSAFHTAVLEPELFDDEVAIAPTVDRRTKIGKQEWTEFRDSNKHKIVLEAKEAAAIVRMQEEILDHELAAALMGDPTGDAEVNVIVNPFSGVNPYTMDEVLSANEAKAIMPTMLHRACKARVDWVTDTELIDVKTCQDASPEAVVRSVVHFGYHLQAAYYRELYRRAAGHDSVLPFVFIFVEKEAPHGVLVCELDDILLEVGWTQCSDALRSVMDWMSFGHQDYAGGRKLIIECPQWLAKKYESRTEAEHANSN
tara:strand:+ start:1516 stop:2451 length:936 start_codon:yes stop_codon:yes gene_type:complete